MKRQILFLFIISFFSIRADAKSDTTESRISTNSSIKINYENDYFTGTDFYYTQGIKIEFVFPCWRYDPLMALLPKLSNSIVEYKINMDQDGFTPTSITVSSIQRGDRPYAGYVYIGHVKISTEEIKKQKLTSEMDIGVIGPSAECGEEQAMIHRWINDRQPDGWKYQIGNQAMMDYRIRYEKGLLNDTCIDFSGMGELNGGNVYDNIKLGGKLRLGKMQSYFSGNRTRKFQLYTFINGWMEGVAYNGTMQGALFSDNSIYTLPSNAINHIVLGYTCGICFSYQSISIDYSFTHISHEIKTGLYHGWGHIGIAAHFK
ncbi:MAG: lipid A deacylase LpxR family protein [Bacteroidia bacterium]